MSEDFEFRISGLDDLNEKIKMAYKVYPDSTILTVKKAGRMLRKSAVDETNVLGVGNVTGNLRKGYRFSVPTKGSGSYGTDVEGIFRAETGKNPHMHLVEHGHRIVKRGKTKHHYETKQKEEGHRSGIGSTGAHMIENALDIFAPKWPTIVDECLSRILRKAKL